MCVDKRPWWFQISNLRLHAVRLKRQRLHYVTERARCSNLPPNPVAFPNLPSGRSHTASKYSRLGRRWTGLAPLDQLPELLRSDCRDDKFGDRIIGDNAQATLSGPFHDDQFVLAAHARDGPNELSPI
jgi:hypothetical protein